MGRGPLFAKVLVAGVCAKELAGLLSGNRWVTTWTHDVHAYRHRREVQAAVGLALFWTAWHLLVEEET